MPAPKFTVEYIDGTTEEIKLLPKAQLAYEAESGRSLRDDIESITQMYELTWYAAGRPDGDINSWIDRVEAIVPEETDEEEVPAERPTSRSKSRG